MIIKLSRDRHIAGRHSEGVLVAARGCGSDFLFSGLIHHCERNQSVTVGRSNAKYHLFTISYRNGLRRVDVIQPDGTTLAGRPRGRYIVGSAHIVGIDGHVIAGHRESIGAISTGLEALYDSVVAVNHLYTREGKDSRINIRHSEVHRLTCLRAARSGYGTSVGTLRINLRSDIVNRGCRDGVGGSTWHNDVADIGLGIDGCSRTHSSDCCSIVGIPSRSAIGAVLERGIDLIGIDAVYQLIEVAADSHLITCSHSAAADRIEGERERVLDDGHLSLGPVDLDAVNASRNLEGVVVVRLETISVCITVGHLIIMACGIDAISIDAAPVVIIASNAC